MADELRALAAEKGGYFARPRVEDAEAAGRGRGMEASGDSREEPSGARKTKEERWDMRR